MSQVSAKALMDTLKASFKEVSDREKARLEAERDFLTAVLEGSELNNQINTTAFSDLFLIDELEKLQIS